ncbi:MAG: DUF268 domain-containing protein [Nitrospinae bacterium]|nr:DUF268 domain-containing protein [Nitrospinota bacterium]
MKKFLNRIYWLLAIQFGFDYRRFVRSLKGVPRFVAGWLHFRSGYEGKMAFYPCLYDWREQAGATDDEYFWQDLHVARKIFAAGPKKHVDVGSRIDGFVAHVASFREVEVFDIRPLSSKVPGITFRRADMTNPLNSFHDYCDSLSCLHSLEHFGLGRYGDPVDPDGYRTGLLNMAKIVRRGGLFYLSVPAGIERVEFNAHRIFDPRRLAELALSHGLELKEIAYMGDGGAIIETSDPKPALEEIGGRPYALCIFTFLRR